MTEVAQTVKNNCITLSGSSTIVCEYLNYGVNSILFQRGIYPPESFSTTQQYGLTIFMSKDEKITEFLKKVLAQAQDWISQNKVEKISMVITNAHTKETLECWDFKIEGDTENSVKENDKEATSTKDLKRIQSEIRDVMRQISATVSFLPLLDCVCSFDVLIYTLRDTEIPDQWNNTEGVFIQNAQAVQLKSFSTGLHKMTTVVNYKMNL
ncbi:mitotic spindle assembly checkpoint protein MAD2A [Phlebotomus argentipes]|uniref:mitotic spindle assembly checkpoint protein MAD2A n=1 Tax=Phlebotomus argentipes TaxID=94469 RepID=UPI002893788A|nr:mitotic spindle assembly checkpoint protein MAD2A [Phlebotomus argentipes]